MFAKTILLISASLGIGYWVMTKANAEKASQKIGKLILIFLGLMGVLKSLVRVYVIILQNV